MGLVALLLGCLGAPTPIETDPPSICGASFSNACTLEEGFCLDPGPYVNGSNINSWFLTQNRYWYENVHRENGFGFRCWTYVARPCSDGLAALAQDGVVTLVDGDSNIIGNGMSGFAWYENYNVDIADACNFLYNGPPAYQDCVLDALNEANALARQCNLYQPCNIDACVVDEVP